MKRNAARLSSGIGLKKLPVVLSAAAVAVPTIAVAVDMHPGCVDAVAMPITAMPIPTVEMNTGMLSAVAIAGVTATKAVAVAVLSHGRVGSKAQGSYGQH